jgi:cyclopropane fatty-acyl-phospholipid synthase-like methyltransferase
MTGSDPRQFAPAAARNRAPLLEVLRRVLPGGARVLEIGSGSGEHAVFFARGMPGVVWRPSDPDPAACASIAAWIEAESAANILAPVAIDVRAENWGVEAEAPFDALVSLNMVHISPWAATLGLMAGAGRIVRDGGMLFLYGPFKREGRHTAPSNRSFDDWLKARDPSFGVRDLADIAAAAQGFALHEIVEMPANNLSLVFKKAPLVA